MRIKKLNIQAFGRFSDKSIELKDGLNLIVGKNEAGKSTLHTFIEGMFYGFFKNNIKNKGYTNKYQAYLPWNHSGYSGNMIIEDEGRVIRIERVFTKKKDRLVIYDHETGDNITDSYEHNKVTSLAEVGKKHIGFGSAMYQNTIGLGQQGSKTEKELVTEIKNNMNNLASTRQINLSVQDVIKRIDEKIKEVGSKRGKTTPYYKVLHEIEEFKEQYKELEDSEKGVELSKNQERMIAKQIEECLKEEKTIEGKLLFFEKERKEKIFDKAKSIGKDISILDIEIKKNESFSEFDIGRVNHLRDLEERLTMQKKQIQELEEDKKNDKKSLEELKGKKEKKQDINYLQEVYKKLNNKMLDYEKKENTLVKKEQELSVIKNQKNAIELVGEPANKNIIYSIVTIMLLTTIYFGWRFRPILLEENLTNDSTSWSSMFIFAIIIAIVLLFSLTGIYIWDKKQKENYISYRNKVTRLDRQINESEEKRKELKIQLLDLLSSEEVEEIRALRDKRDKALSKRSSADQINKVQIDLEERIHTVEKEIKTNSITLLNGQEEYNKIKMERTNELDRFNIIEKEGIQLGFNRYTQYNKDKAEREQLIIRKNELLAGISLEELINQIDHMIVVKSEDEDENSLKEKLVKLKEEYSEAKEEKWKITTHRGEMEKLVGKKAILDEKINNDEEKMREYDRILKTRNIMKEAIEKIAIDVQNNFAPELNKFMSDVIQKVSNNKYKDIKVNPNMQLVLYDESIHKTVRVEELSGGTIDLCYFALRKGIVKVLSKDKKVPLILDDAFVQYDKERLENMLELLANKDQQVLLFTCHKREKKYLEDNSISYNLIEL